MSLLFKMKLNIPNETTLSKPEVKINIQKTNNFSLVSTKRVCKPMILTGNKKCSSCGGR